MLLFLKKFFKLYLKYIILLVIFFLISLFFVLYLNNEIYWIYFIISFWLVLLGIMLSMIFFIIFNIDLKDKIIIKLNFFRYFILFLLIVMFFFF